MDLTEYSQNSPFVKEYAIEGDGLPNSAPASEIVNTAEKVVLIDAFLRKHYDTLSEHELEVVTGVRHPKIQDIVVEFQNAGLIKLEDSLYTVANMDDEVTALRQLQLDLLD